MTLSEELHFRRAAEKLFIAQPALSNQIKSLENELGVLLFKRDKRNVSLTMAGKFLQSEGYHILNQMNFIKSAISDIGKTISGTVTIGCIGSAMAKIVPELIVQIEKEFPRIKTRIIEDTTQNLVNSLRDNKIDLVFCRPHAQLPMINSKQLCIEPTVVAVSKFNKWSINRNSVISDFENVPFILFPEEAGILFRNQIVQICTQNNFYPNIKHESIHSNSILRLVEQDIGVSLIPESLSKGHNFSNEYLKIKELTISLELMVSYRTDNSNELLKSILKLIDQ